MNILITGIYGFLGSNLANELVRNHNVFGLYNKNKKDNLDKSIQTSNELDLIDYKPDVIIMCHAAVVSGQDRISNDVLLEINVDFTKKILDKFPFSKCIYISSVSVYGENIERITEKTKENPLSDYAKSKYLGEQIVMHNPKNRVIRLSSLYGEGMKENTLIPNYSNQALQNKKIEVWGNGSRFQNYIHVSDVIALVTKIITFSDKVDFPVLAVDNKEYSNFQTAEIIAKLTDSRIEFIKEDDSKSFFYDNIISQKTLNWQPKITLEEGLKKYLEWKEKQS